MTDIARPFFLVNGTVYESDTFEAFFTPDRYYSYEVFRIINGVPLFIEDHLERFAETCRMAGDVPLIDNASLLPDIQRLIAANERGEGNVKIAVISGKTGRKNVLVYFTPHQYPSEQQFRDGVAVDLLSAERINPNAKVLDVALRQQTDKARTEKQLYEILLVDHAGYITEGSRSNVFFIRNNAVITPPAGTVLPGVTRKHIVRLCIGNGIEINELQVHAAGVSGMDALFLSGTSRKVLPVNAVGPYTFPVNHQLVNRISELFDEEVRSYLNART